MMFGKIRSHLIMLKASRYQGCSQFEEAIEMSLTALDLNPKSYMALLVLGDDYSRLKQYEEAEDVLRKALKIYPADPQFSYMMAAAMINNSEPVENAMPHLRAYLGSALGQKVSFPFYVKILAKLSGKKLAWDKYGEKLNGYNDSRYQWAQSIVSEFEKGDEGSCGSADLS